MDSNSDVQNELNAMLGAANAAIGVNRIPSNHAVEKKSNLH